MVRLKKDRSNTLIELADRKSEEFLDSLIGKKLKILFETKAGNVVEGYSTNYVKVGVNSGEDLEGQIKTVIIEERREDLLLGKLL